MFSKHQGLKWLTIGVIVAVYSIPIYKVYVRKTLPEMTPRSPNMITIFLCFLLLDSVMNTYLFAIKSEQTPQT